MAVTIVVSNIGAGLDFADVPAWLAKGPKDCTLNVTAVVGSATASTTTAIQLDAAASATAGAYVGNTLAIGSEMRLITAYDATTKIATVGALNGSPAGFTTAPSAGTSYTIGQVIWKGLAPKAGLTGAGAAFSAFTRTCNASCYYWLSVVAGGSYMDDPGFDAKAYRYDPNYAKLDINAGGTYAFQGDVTYLRVDRLQIINSAAATGIVPLLNVTGPNAWFDHCQIMANANHPTVRGLFRSNGNIFSNCLFDQRSNDPAAWLGDLRGGSFYHCAFAATGGVNLGYAFHTQNLASAMKNCVVVGATAVDDAAFPPTATNCAADSTKAGWLTVPYNNTVFAKVASDGTHDLRLIATSPLVNAGVTLTGAEAQYGATDAGGRARPQGAAPDIGPMEYIPPAAAPVSFSGPVPTRNGAVGTAASFANAGFFAGTATPFTYSLQAGVLPAGLTLSASTGIISGTPTTAGTQSGIVVRATDANSATADTNAYSIVIAASNASPTFPGSIANITGTAGTAITPVNTSGQFSDTDALTYSASPTGTAWPSGLTVNSSTGIISGTVAAATTVTGLKVRATDTAGQTVDSNTFSVTISAAAATAGTITWPFPIAPVNGDARLAAGHRIAVCNVTTDALVVRKTGLVTHATTGAPPVISDALIVPGTQYRCHLILDSDNAASGTEVITAT